MDKFYFVGYMGKRVEELHLMDIIDKENVMLISDNVDETKFFCGRQETAFYKAHEWSRICDKDPIAIGMWNRFYTIYNFQYEKENNHYIIFWDSALTQLYSEQFFKSLKRRHPNVKLVMYIYDQMNRWYSPRVERMTKYADLVLCTNPQDCRQYGFDYFPLVYSSYPLEGAKRRDNSDIYFMGNNGDRDEMLHEIYRYLTSKGVICDFNIVGVPEERQLYKGEILYNRNFGMDENISRVIATNCVLEIMHKGMNAVTARYPEILQHNKKLLTNNRAIVHEKYYNPDYIKVYESVEDIDVEWIRRRENVDYGYEGDFSPLKLMEEVKNKCG